MDWLARTRILIGDDAVQRLSQSRIAVLGLGGVGSAAAEAVCRSGVGNMLLVDCDTVDITNINRQLIATSENVGSSKCVEGKRRMLAINPSLDVQIGEIMLTPDNLEFIADYRPDYVIDAIDNVTAKLALVELCKQRNIPLLTCLGTGNRLDPSKLLIGDISDTAGCGCPLARVIRRELRRRGIANQTVLYSIEEAIKINAAQLAANGRHSPASMAFVPLTAGILLASYAVRSILGLTK